MDIEKLITRANHLIDHKDEFEFGIESELQPFVKQLCTLDYSIAGHEAVKIKTLFKRIICMDKSTDAFGFYFFLSDSKLLFAEELMIYAIDHEPYYNNNDMVFMLYLRTAFKNTLLKDMIETIISSQIIQGHHSNYDVIFTEMRNLRLNLKPSGVSSDIEMEIIHSVSTSTFHHRIFKAIAIAILFNLKDAIKPIKRMCRDQAGKMMRLAMFNDYKPLWDGELGGEIRVMKDLSLAMFYLTNEEKYNQAYHIAISKGAIPGLEKNYITSSLFSELVIFLIKEKI